MNLISKEETVRIRSLFLDPMKYLIEEQYSVMFITPNEYIGKRIIIDYIEASYFVDGRVILFEEEKTGLLNHLPKQTIHLELKDLKEKGVSREKVLRTVPSRMRPDCVIYPNILKEDYFSAILLGHGTKAILNVVEKDIQSFLSFSTINKPGIYSHINCYAEVDELGKITRIYKTQFPKDELTLIYVRR